MKTIKFHAKLIMLFTIISACVISCKKDPREKIPDKGNFSDNSIKIHKSIEDYERYDPDSTIVMDIINGFHGEKEAWDENHETNVSDRTITVGFWEIEVVLNYDYGHIFYEYCLQDDKFDTTSITLEIIDYDEGVPIIDGNEFMEKYSGLEEFVIADIDEDTMVQLVDIKITDIEDEIITLRAARIRSKVTELERISYPEQFQSGDSRRSCHPPPSAVTAFTNRLNRTNVDIEDVTDIISASGQGVVWQWFENEIIWPTTTGCSDCLWHGLYHDQIMYYQELNEYLNKGYDNWVNYGKHGAGKIWTNYVHFSWFQDPPYYNPCYYHHAEILHNSKMILLPNY
ncbi:hypothetical protein ACFLRZ_00725 [Bacteroidota bacterium]